VFQAEILAIKEALSWIKDNREKWCYGGFCIWSDSKAAIGALRSVETRSSL
ncbi:Hypothetical protein FKW44_002307, partial [Caligus rogercresseyi]